MDRFFCGYHAKIHEGTPAWCSDDDTYHLCRRAAIWLGKILPLVKEQQMNEYLLVWEAPIRRSETQEHTTARRVAADSPEQAMEEPHIPMNREVYVYHIPVGVFKKTSAVVVSKVDSA